MSRRLPTVILVTSLVFCATVVALQFWRIPQYFPQIEAEYHANNARLLGVERIEFDRAFDAACAKCKPDAALTPEKFAAMPVHTDAKDFVIGDVAAIRILSTRNGTATPVSKWWAAPLAFAAIAANAARRRIPPAPNGRCVCGYDLRATPDRCPECGRFPKR